MDIQTSRLEPRFLSNRLTTSGDEIVTCNPRVQSALPPNFKRRSESLSECFTKRG
jgi:hypothetical protein